MPISRDLRPGFFTDEKIADLPLGACLLFQGIWVHADLRGVFEWSARLLRSLIFAIRSDVTPKNVADWIVALERSGMVRHFEAEGKEWGIITHWHKHQSISTREIEAGSDRPSPNDWSDPEQWREILEKAVKAKRNVRRWLQAGCSTVVLRTASEQHGNNTGTPLPSPVSRLPSPVYIPPTPLPAKRERKAKEPWEEVYHKQSVKLKGPIPEKKEAVRFACDKYGIAETEQYLDKLDTPLWAGELLEEMAASWANFPPLKQPKAPAPATAPASDDPQPF